MREKLTLAFSPHILELVDDSNRHHGHIGANPSGESHFNLKIAADAFVGKSRVQQHRMVHEVLANELQGRVHALAMEIVA